MFQPSLIRLFIALSMTLILSACQSDHPGEIWPMVKDCDLHRQACLSKQGEAQATLSITPRPIPIAKPLDIHVELKGLQAQKVELDISGLNMYMGYNRVTLEPQGEIGQFTGRSMLAFCTNEVMLWQVTILIHHPNGQVLQIPYQLETRNR